jgi:predicted negative regulator of RcsB-dependent stress response
MFSTEVAMVVAFLLGAGGVVGMFLWSMWQDYVERRLEESQPGVMKVD